MFRRMPEHTNNNPFRNQQVTDATEASEAAGMINHAAITRSPADQLADVFREPPSGVKVEYFPAEILHPDELYVDSERTARVAHANQISYEKSSRYVKANYNMHTNDVAAIQELQHIMDNTKRAVSVLTGIGYNNFRHLQAAGYSLYEIGMSFDINVLDLIAFMSSHQDAEKHAVLDSTACADAKFAQLVKTIEQSAPVTKYEADKMKVLTAATELMVKRLSADWVGAYRQSDGTTAGLPGGAGLTINMNIGGNSSVPQPQVKAVAAAGGDPQQLTIEADSIISDESMDALAEELGV